MSIANCPFIPVTTPDGDTPETQPGPLPHEPAPRAARFGQLRAIVPHAITACVAVVVTLALFGLWQQPRPAIALPPTTVPAPTTVVTPLPTPTSGPTPAPLAPGVARQEIADLQAEDDRLWATVYLLKAVSQVAEAESSLRTNDMANVDQALIAADYSLSLAYSRADESQKSPIDQFRRNVDRIRGDLYLYPERMDARLSQLRQFLLALIDEPK